MKKVQSEEKGSKFFGWGKYPGASCSAYRFESEQSLQALLNSRYPSIARGNGRSYGDSALTENLILVRPYNYFLEFDRENGLIRCQAGVLLAEILETVVPYGWFLSVTPGTRLVTLGGAIASDVHGKNHHLAGTFSQSVTEFKLMTRDGQVVVCSATKNQELFRATCGGMGLTGVILEAKLKLQPIASSMINQVTIKTRNLAETFEAFDQYKESTYSVAWIDCLASGPQLGRSLLMLGEHAQQGPLVYEGKQKLSVPFDFPSFVLNKYSIRAFNAAYYARASTGVSHQQVDLDAFFYPLDALDNWNRIYGKKGFLQYQFVLPLDRSYQGLEKILKKISSRGKGSFLAVLKLFGRANDNWLSFPMEGYTLSLDFKMESGLLGLFDELDKIVLDNGGRFYLAKDARITKEKFESGYRDIEKFRDLREAQQMNKRFNSLQSERVGI